jgi:hypothetical protein
MLARADALEERRAALAPALDPASTASGSADHDVTLDSPWIGAWGAVGGVRQVQGGHTGGNR